MKQDNLSNLIEDEFLKLILNHSPDKHLIQRYTLDTLDWDYVRKKINSQKIPPSLLYYNLIKINLIQRIPKNIQSYLKKAYLKNLARNYILLDEFTKLKTKFEARGITTMLLKGMALFYSVYKDIGSRPISDIDFLIQKKDVEKAKSLLLKSGYEKDKDPFGYSRIKGGITIRLDMQYDIWYLRSLSRLKSNMYGIEQIWRNSRKAYLGDNNSAQIMAPEDLLINVSAHAGIDHGKAMWLWQYDIASICEVFKEELGWEIFVDKVVAYNLQIPIYYMLKLIKERPNGKIPAFVLDRLEPTKGKSPAVKLYEGILEDSIITDVGHFLRIITTTRIVSKLRLILFYLFPDKKFMILRYNIKNKNLLYFYYPLRATSFIPKLFKIVVRLLMH